MNLNKALLTLLLLVCLCLLGLGMTHEHVFKPSTASTRFVAAPQQLAGQRTREEATPIEIGVKTGRQREHGKLFKGTHYIRGKKISELVAERGDVALSGPILEVPILPNVTLGDALAYITCGADAIITGTVKSKASNLIETDTFVFTDYEVEINEVLKDGVAAPLVPNDVIVVPRLGGVVALNGHTVRANDEAMAGLVVGERYLLYLRFIPSTGGYRPLGHPAFDDTFHLAGGRFTQVSRKQLPLGWDRDAEAGSFMSDVRNALAHSCAPGGNHD
jgi:hypothetical protein